MTNVSFSLTLKAKLHFYVHCPRKIQIAALYFEPIFGSNSLKERIFSVDAMMKYRRRENALLIPAEKISSDARPEK